MKERHIFKSFPDHRTCPICGTNRNAKCVLIPTKGTFKDDLCEGTPMHLNCAIAMLWIPESKLGIIQPVTAVVPIMGKLSDGQNETPNGNA